MHETRARNGSIQVKLDDGTGRIVYVPLLTAVGKKDDIPDVNMIKVRHETGARTSEDASVRSSRLSLPPLDRCLP